MSLYFYLGLILKFRVHLTYITAGTTCLLCIALNYVIIIVSYSPKHVSSSLEEKSKSHNFLSFISPLNYQEEKRQGVLSA